MKHSRFIRNITGLLFLFSSISFASDLNLQLEAVRKIWTQGQREPGVIDSYCAFTDLAFVGDSFFVTFRESNAHVGGRDGRIAVIKSNDGIAWTRVADFRMDDFDLRDSKLAMDDNGQLMVWFTGADYEGTYLERRKTWISFWDSVNSEFGPMIETFAGPDGVYQQYESEWPWRLTWNNSMAYTASYRSISAHPNQDHWLFNSTDGIQFNAVVKMPLPARSSEMTLRFANNDEMICLVRSYANQAYIGWSDLAGGYTTWSWNALLDENSLHREIGGPNFIILPNGRLLAAGRQYQSTSTGSKMTGLFEITKDGLWEDLLELPSGGDNSYAGLYLDGNTLYISYYSGHEGGSPNIYFAIVNGNFGQPNQPYNPQPYDEQAEVPLETELSWQCFGEAVSYDVYFGTNSASLIFQDNVTELSYAGLGILDINTEYYWRVDTRDDSGTLLNAGDVWSFVSGEPICQSHPQGDLNDDCIVDLNDFALLLMDWEK